MDRTYQFIASPDNEPGIECLRCGSVSWNPNDVSSMYCGKCHLFHERTSVLGKPDYCLSEERDAAARARSRVVFDRLRPDFETLNHMSARAQKEPVLKRKVIWLWRLAQPLKKATEGQAACKKGCAHCCYTPVLLSHTEAEVIADMSGRKMTSPASYTIEANRDYIGVPCPFLEDNCCSIYGARPFSCRIHYNMDQDASQCVLDSDVSKPVPYLNRTAFDESYVDAFGKREVRYADIRDFFRK